MGTSLEQIDRTYGHLVADAEDRNVEALDAYDAACGRLVDAERRPGEQSPCISRIPGRLVSHLWGVGTPKAGISPK